MVLAYEIHGPKLGSNYLGTCNRPKSGTQLETGPKIGLHHFVGVWLQVDQQMWPSYSPDASIGQELKMHAVSRARALNWINEVVNGHSYPICQQSQEILLLIWDPLMIRFGWDLVWPYQNTCYLNMIISTFNWVHYQPIKQRSQYLRQSCSQSCIHMSCTFIKGFKGLLVALMPLSFLCNLLKLVSFCALFDPRQFLGKKRFQVPKGIFKNSKATAIFRGQQQLNDSSGMTLDNNGNENN